MSTTATKEAPVAKPAAEQYVPPPIQIGDTVLFWRGPETKAAVTAHVTGVGEKVIAVSVFVPGSINVFPESGVRHKSDPDRGRYETSPLWDYTPQHKAYLALQERLNRLADSLEV